MRIYDIVKDPSGSSFEIIQILNPETAMGIPTEGGLPRKLSIPELTLVKSLFEEAEKLTSEESFLRLINEAEERWKKHSEKTPSRRKSKGSKIALDIDIGL